MCAFAVIDPAAGTLLCDTSHTHPTLSASEKIQGQHACWQWSVPQSAPSPLRFTHLSVLHRSGTTLDALSLKSSPLMESDLKHLSEYLSWYQSAQASVSDQHLCGGVQPEPPRPCLEQVAGSLETLVLDYCRIPGFKFHAILPALDPQLHLGTASLCLFWRTFCQAARLRQFWQRLYPVPMESLLVTAVLCFTTSHFFSSLLGWGRYWGTEGYKVWFSSNFYESL